MQPPISSTAVRISAFTQTLPRETFIQTRTSFSLTQPNSESQQQLRIADLLLNLSKALIQILYVSNVPAWI